MTQWIDQAMLDEQGSECVVFWRNPARWVVRDPRAYWFWLSVFILAPAWAISVAMLAYAEPPSQFGSPMMIVNAPTPPVSSGFLLLEGGGFLLLEGGGKIILNAH